MQEHFKSGMRQWQTGICLVTAHSEGAAPVGLVCNSFTSVSLDPPLVAWGVDHGSSAIDAWRDATSYAVHVLPILEKPMDHPLVAKFAQRGGNKFSGLNYELNEHGDPVFSEIETRFDCVLHERITVGDHDLMIGRPTNINYPTKNTEQ